MVEAVYDQSMERSAKEFSRERDDGRIDADLMDDMVHGEEHDDMSDSDGSDELDRFKLVIDAIDFERLPEFAVSVRLGNLPSDMLDISASTGCSSAPLTCTVVTPPLTGSYNILYRLKFSDGVRWMFKVPVTGYRARFDELAAQALGSEAMTMRLLKRKTTIPVPDLHYFNTSFDHVVKCPFIMDRLEGCSLDELWFSSGSRDAIEQFRQRILKQLATAMVQLSAFTYEEGGSLRFDKAGNVASIGPARANDLVAEHRRMCSYYDSDDDEDHDYCPLYYAKGPVKSPKAFLSVIMERGPPQREPAKYNRGNHLLLQMFIDWMSYDHTRCRPPFILAHPDFDLQNILVSEDGTLQGIIDWDGASAVPRCFGQYPLWLTRDWEPKKYNWNYEKSELANEFGPPEDSPEKLKHYRAMYAQFIKESSTNAGPVAELSMNNAISDVAMDIVNPRSLLLRTLAVAVEEPLAIARHIRFIFEAIERLTAADWNEVAVKVQSDASSAYEIECDTTANSRSQVYTDLNEQPCQTGFNDVEVTEERAESYKHKIIRPEIGVAGSREKVLLSGSRRQTSAVESASNQVSKPLCYRTQHGLLCLGKLFHKRKPEKPLRVAKHQSGIVQARQIRISFPTKNAGILTASTEPATAEPCASESVESSRGWFQKALRIFRRPQSQKAELNKDREAKPSPDRARLTEETKSRGSYLRNTFRHTLSALRKNKLCESSREPEPQQAEASAFDQINPRRNWIQCALTRAFPCFYKSKVEMPEAQARVSPAGNGEDYVWSPFRQGLEDAGVTAGRIKELSPMLIATTKEATQHQLSQESIPQEDKLLPIPESPKSSETTEDKAKAYIKDVTERQAYDPRYFNLWDITHALADDTLPDESMARLKQGFAALVASAS